LIVLSKWYLRKCKVRERREKI